MDFRALLNALDSVNEAEGVEIKATRRVQDNGGLTNFNINDNDPSKLFTGLRNGGDNYSRDDVVKVYYKNDERLQQFLSGSDGRGAVEVNAEGKPVDAPQSDAELDADSADNGATTAGDRNPRSNPDRQPSEPQPLDSGTLSSGAKLSDLDDAGLRQLAADLNSRLQDLLRRADESAPVSLKGYLSESDLAQLLKEALSQQEAQEFKNVYNDLQIIIRSGRIPEPIANDFNRMLARNATRIDTILGSLEQPAAQTTPTDSANAPGEIAANAGEPTTADDAEEPPAAAQAASDDSGDQGASVDPGEGNTSGSLEAFADSGKGGLANDADETAAIEELQQFLTDNGFDPNGVDGKYGRGTIAAVKRFQEAFGAAVDGDAGPETIGKIVEFRNDMAELDELINAAKSEGATAGSNESVDFRSLIGLVESMLKEAALTDQQKSRAEELIAKYQPLVDKLPEPAKGQLSQRIEDLQGFMATSGASDEEPEADTTSDDGGSTSTNEPRSDAEIAADPDRDGNADDPEAQTFIDDNPAQARQLALAMNGPGTDEDKIFDVLQSLRSVQSWENLKREYQADQNEDLMTRFKDELNTNDMRRYVLDPLEDLGVEFDEEGNEVARAEEPTAEPAASADNGSGQGAAASIAQLPDPQTEEDAMQIIAASEELQADLMAELTPEEQELFREMLAATGAGQ